MYQNLDILICDQYLLYIVSICIRQFFGMKSLMVKCVDMQKKDIPIDSS